MNKYLIVGIISLSLLATTVYALNDNNHNASINEPTTSTTYNQNCPYHNDDNECPYHNGTTDTYNCPNSENVNYSHHHTNCGNGHGRHGGYYHHNH